MSVHSDLFFSFFFSQPIFSSCCYSYTRHKQEGSEESIFYAGLPASFTSLLLLSHKTVMDATLYTIFRGKCLNIVKKKIYASVFSLWMLPVLFFQREIHIARTDCPANLLRLLFFSFLPFSFLFLSITF